MIIKSNLRPTTIRTNSRYRGQTELGKYTNFILESVHDLKLLGSVMDRNEFVEGHKGHTDFINDNLVAYVGGGTPITANINTATTINHPGKNVLESTNLMDSAWTTYGGCSKTAGLRGTILTTSGLLDPSGIRTQKQVEEGDIIYIRMGVRFISGDHTALTIGSHDINQNESDLERYKLPENGSIIYIDKRLYCKHREPITINIDVHNLPDMLEATSIEVFELSIQYLSENGLVVEPINTVLKSKVNTLESNIKNIINNI